MDYFKRQYSAFLDQWWVQEHRKPLLLRGARQVGKSTLVRQFAEKQKLELLEVNLERHFELDQIFKTYNVQKIIASLEGIFGKKVSTNSLIFLDEIQATPNAIAAMRYFYEDRPQIPLVAAGSLLEFILGEGLISMPVGRIQYLYITPMTFSEYLEAKGETYLLNLLKSLDPYKPPALTVHKRMLGLQREYLFVGGMPEAIRAFLKNNDPHSSILVGQSILDTYRDDFHKYSSKIESVRLQRVFQRVARYLNQKVKYTALDPDENSRETKKTLELLAQAKIVSRVYHSAANGIPLGAEANFNVFKLLFLDVGLVNRLLGLSWHELMDMAERALIHEGPLAEQFIGQSLLSLFSNNGTQEPQVYYWLRESRASNAEVDFVVSVGTHVVPVEVKSGKSGSIKSLLQFVAEKNSRLAIRFDLSPISMQTIQHRIGSEKVKFNFLSVPLYAVDEVFRLASLSL
jgi:predicted AAA+ superfamily ATPase